MDRHKFRRSRSPMVAARRGSDRAESRDRHHHQRRREKYRHSRTPSPPPAPKLRRRSRSRSRHRSRSPGDNRKGGGPINRMNPSPSRVLGIFGLSVHTGESTIRQIFSKFGPIDRLNVVYDSKTGRSRGFCFVYYQNTEDARAAKDQCTGMEIDRQRIRVDFSLTARPHSPTPGVYMGKPTTRGGDNGEREHRDYHDYNSSSHSSSSHPPPYRRRRSPSPQYRRRRNRSTSYSPRNR